MPKIPVDECPAGPAMDAAVAETLGFETKWFGYPNGSKILLCLVGKIASKHDGWTEQDDWRSVPPYSTDIAAAWGLAESCRHSGFGVGWSEDWGAPYCMMGDTYEYGETVPHAICRAFLKANGVEYIEVPE